MQTQAPDILAALDRIERRLDEINDRQAMIEDLYDEMVPVVREVMRTASSHLGELERRGLFDRGAALLRLADAALDQIAVADIEGFTGNVANLVDTFRNVTQPDVLAVANEATDVLHHADDVSPVGVFGMAKASSDPEIQKGLGVALGILRQLGRARGGNAVERRSAPPPAASLPVAPVVSMASAPRASAAPSCDPPTATPSAAVTWEGRSFSADGFLIDPATWDEDLALKMAASLGLALTDQHWIAIRWARADYLQNQASPNVRRVASGSGLGTKALYDLFPQTPGKTNAMLAGIPKPAGCV
jgi:TusE/DsrC/DsvC family sulfur relay protein